MDARPTDPAPPAGPAAPGADAASVEASPRRPKRGYLVPGIIALVVLAALAVIINYAGLSHPSPHTLSGSDAATLISQGLQSDQGASSPPQISCPAREPIRAGVTFRCTWHRPGGTLTPVEVTETDGTGNLRFRTLPSS